MRTATGNVVRSKKLKTTDVEGRVLTGTLSGRIDLLSATMRSLSGSSEPRNSMDSDAIQQAHKAVGEMAVSFFAGFWHSTATELPTREEIVPKRAFTKLV